MTALKMQHWHHFTYKTIESNKDNCFIDDVHDT